MNENLSKELLIMLKRDQSARAFGKLNSRLDKANANKLKKIIAKIGWPDYKKVGKDAATAAWLIAQHADFSPSFQKECLKEMRKAVRKGLADKTMLVYLIDRVLVNTGKKQIYGTQWHLQDGKMKPRAMRSLAQAKRLRKKFDLPTLEAYGRRIQELQDKIKKAA